MGIKGLYKLIKRYAPDAIQEKKIEDYVGKSVAIDISLWIHQLYCGSKRNAPSLKNRLDDTDDENEDECDKDTYYLYGLLCRINKLLKYKITPIIVYDGRTSVLKKNTIKLRKQKSHVAKEKIKNSKTQSEKKKYQAQSFRISKKQIDETKYLLKLLGLPYIESIEEADATCVKLYQKKMVDLIISDDSDILTFGGGVLVRNLGSSKTIMLEYCLDNILDKLQIDYNQFIDLCILLGSDYCPTIKGIGLVRSYDKIKKYKNIETILKYVKDIPDDFCYRETRNYFLDPPASVISKQFKFKKYDITKIPDLFEDEHKTRVHIELDKYKKYRSLF